MFVHYFNRYQVRMTPSSFSLPPPDSLHIRPDGTDVNPKIHDPAGASGRTPCCLMFKDAPSSPTWNVERGVGNERKSYAHAPRILYFSSAPVSSSRGRRFVCLTTRQTWNVETRNVEAGESFRQLQAQHP